VDVLKKATHYTAARLTTERMDRKKSRVVEISEEKYPCTNWQKYAYTNWQKTCCTEMSCNKKVIWPYY
jgi:hypothetical protein